MTDTVLLSPEEVSALSATGKTVIIDTRDPKSYASGHIPGAVNLHEIFTYLSTSTPEGMAELSRKFAAAFGAAGLGGAETAIIYEQSMNTGFGQSCRGYYLLKYLGYPSAKILHGGLEAWKAKGLPTSTADQVELTARHVPVRADARAGVGDDWKRWRLTVFAAQWRICWRYCARGN
jgi:thiosulfate/3-mercaptopyruvate sulfurtransferase